MLLFAAVTSAAFRKTQLVAEPVQTHKFARQVQNHTFPARCGATTGCSLDSRGKAVQPAQIKQLTSASTRSQYVTNVTWPTAKRISTHTRATRQHCTSVAIQTNMLLQRKHLAQVACICRPTTATFPPKLPRSNDAITRKSPCRQSFSKLLAPILLSTSAAFAEVTAELLAPGDGMLYAYASISRMQGWPVHMQQ